MIRDAWVPAYARFLLEQLVCGRQALFITSFKRGKTCQGTDWGFATGDLRLKRKLLSKVDLASMMSSCLIPDLILETTCRTISRVLVYFSTLFFSFCNENGRQEISHQRLQG